MLKNNSTRKDVTSSLQVNPVGTGGQTSKLPFPLQNYGQRSLLNVSCGQVTCIEKSSRIKVISTGWQFLSLDSRRLLYYPMVRLPQTGRSFGKTSSWTLAEVAHQDSGRNNSMFVVYIIPGHKLWNKCKLSHEDFRLLAFSHRCSLEMLSLKHRLILAATAGGPILTL